MHDILQYWTQIDAWTQLLILAALKGTLLLGLGFSAAYLLRRNSASLRHLTWGLLLTALLLLPVLMLGAPSLPLQVLPPSAAVQSPVPAQQARDFAGVNPLETDSKAGELRPAQRSSAAPSRLEPLVPMLPGQMPSPLALSPAQVVLGLWLAGVLLAVGRLLLAAALLRRELALARQPDEQAWTNLLNQVRQHLGLKRQVRLRLGRSQQMPLVWGLMRPVILLPAQADQWTSQERRAVLLHEAAHIKRHDLLVQLVASLACALYWFNPLVWMAAKAIRREREQACDDLVLRCGTRPSAYARQLLTLAQRMKGARLVSAASLAMSRPSELEGRLLAILNRRQNRGAASPRVMLALAVLILVAAGPLAALTPVPQETQPAETPQAEAKEAQGQTATTQSGLSVSESSAATGKGSVSAGASVAGVGSGPSAAVRGTSVGGPGAGTGVGQPGAASAVSTSAGVAVGGGLGPSTATGGWGATAYQSQEHEVANPGTRSGNISLSERDGSRWRIEMEGLKVDEDYALAGFEEDGYLRIEVRRQGRTEVLTVEPDGQGGMERSYRVEGTVVDDPDAGEELLQEGLERLRRTDSSHAEARRNVEQARLQIEEARMQSQALREDHQRLLREAQEVQRLREQELGQVMRQTRERLRQVEQRHKLQELDHRQVMREMEEHLHALRESHPELSREKLAATEEALHAALATRRQALEADQTRLAAEMAELSEQLQRQLGQVRQNHAVAMERMDLIHRQLEEEMQTGLAERMDVISESMDRLRREMDHLRSNLEAARDHIQSALRRGLEGHDLGWESSRLERRLDSLVSDLLNLGELNEEDGRFRFSAPRGEVLSLLNQALADPLERLQGSSRSSLRQSLDGLADQLSDLRW